MSAARCAVAAPNRRSCSGAVRVALLQVARRDCCRGAADLGCVSSLSRGGAQNREGQADADADKHRNHHLRAKSPKLHPPRGPLGSACVRVIAKGATVRARRRTVLEWSGLCCWIATTCTGCAAGSLQHAPAVLLDRYNRHRNDRCNVIGGGRSLCADGLVRPEVADLERDVPLDLRVLPSTPEYCRVLPRTG